MTRLKKEVYRFAIVIFFTVVTMGMIFGVQKAEASGKIKLNKKEIILDKGKNCRLKLKNTKKQPSWSCSDPSIASVSPKGKVTAKKTGTVKITAKLGKKKYTCTVKVKKQKTRPQEKNLEIINDKIPFSPIAKEETKEKDVNEKNIEEKNNYAQQILELVNTERKKQGLSSVVLDEKLSQAANKRAKEIVTTFSHTRPNGESCFTVLKEYNITYRTTGENIAAGQPTPESVMNSWMNSPGHRANILNGAFKKIGVGYVGTDGLGYRTYWVQLFTN